MLLWAVAFLNNWRVAVSSSGTKLIASSPFLSLILEAMDCSHIYEILEMEGGLLGVRTRIQQTLYSRRALLCVL